MNGSHFLDWNAAEYFRNLVSQNKFAQENGFRFRVVSSLEGFYDLVSDVQNKAPILAVSDVSSGTVHINNSPRARRIKTVFLAMRHRADDPGARAKCMQSLQELFRQFMSRLILERERLAEGCIYVDPDISFVEVDKYFFSGCACAYFQIAVDTYADISLNKEEWLNI